MPQLTDEEWKARAEEFMRMRREMAQNGPWKGEPDLKEFIHAGLPCIIRRGDVTGALCGYVGIGRGHPYFGLDYNELYRMGIELDAHGGITFSGAQKDDGKHYFGFDCSHCFDVMPYIGSTALPGAVYRDMGYVEAETRALADQLAAAGAKGIVARVWYGGILRWLIRFGDWAERIKRQCKSSLIRISKRN